MKTFQISQGAKITLESSPAAYKPKRAELPGKGTDSGAPGKYILQPVGLSIICEVVPKVQ